MRCFVNSSLRRTTHLAAAMKLELVVHETEEGGYWAEVPAIPGCATQADSFLPCEKLDRTSLRQPPLPQDIVTFDAEQDIVTFDRSSAGRPTPPRY